MLIDGSGVSSRISQASLIVLSSFKERSQGNDVNCRENRNHETPVKCTLR